MNQEKVYRRIKRKKILKTIEKIDRDKLNELIERARKLRKVGV